MTELNEHFYQLLEQVGAAQQAVKEFVEGEGNRSESFAYVEERLQVIVAKTEFIRQLVKERSNRNESIIRR